MAEIKVSFNRIEAVMKEIERSARSWEREQKRYAEMTVNADDFDKRTYTMMVMTCKARAEALRDSLDEIGMEFRSELEDMKND